LLNSPFPREVVLPNIDEESEKPTKAMDAQPAVPVDAVKYLEMDSVIEKRLTGRGWELKVKWRDTWVPEKDLLEFAQRAKFEETLQQPE
jgi:hypothetical protein